MDERRSFVRGLTPAVADDADRPENFRLTGHRGPPPCRVHHLITTFTTLFGARVGNFSYILDMRLWSFSRALEGGTCPWH